VHSLILETRNSRSRRVVVDQLVDQLRQDFWGDGARKCDTHKALDFPTLRFGTRGSEVQILSPRPLPKSCPSLVYATLSDFIASTFCGPM